MTILQNAVDSIAVGLEDYETSDERRLLSATRNIFAGILLLFKHKLCELSPENSDEALIKQTVLPEFDATGAVNWIGKGKKTVDVQNIKERFQSLKIEVEWKRLDRINKYRNDIEHYYSAMNMESVQQLISDSFIIIRDFISEHLGEDPQELLGEEAWDTLIKVNEVYEREKEECKKILSMLNYFSEGVEDAIFEYKCDECGSELIFPYYPGGNASENGYECRSCRQSYAYEDIAKSAIPEYFRDATYVSMTDGGDSPIVACPECSEYTYLYKEAVCGACGCSADHECQRCGCTIPPEEISEDSVCGWCSHMMAKDD